MRNFAFLIGSSAVLAASLSQASTVLYIESGGQVVGEAEHYSRRDTSGGHGWQEVPTESTGAGSHANQRGTYMQDMPDNGGGGTPGLYFDIQITTTGTYRLWMRVSGNNTDFNTSGSSDSMFVDLRDSSNAVVDGNYYENTYPLSQGSDFTWDGGGEANVNQAGAASNPIIWNITTPGIYTLRFYPREDGGALDAWIFQLSNLSGPAANDVGPAETLYTVPEPASLALLGLPALALTRRRR